MLKITGIILLLGGCIGYGLCINNSMKGAVRELKEYIYIFELLKSSIAYQREILPRACIYTGKKAGGAIGKALIRIGENSENNRDKNFSQYWKEEMKSSLKKSLLQKEDREYLYGFPEYIGFSDEKMQLTVMEEFVVQLKKRKEEMEKAYRERKRVVMGLCTAGGLMLVVLLL